jgi:8-oxo-dGTP diphosphatase
LRVRTGCLQLPGGHLEVGETFEHCARREIFEETGINLDSREEDVIKFVTSTNDVFDESEGGKHYVTVFMACQVDGAVQPKVSKLSNF